MYLQKLRLPIILFALLLSACEKELVSPETENSGDNLKSGTALPDGSYQLTEVDDFDPLYKFEKTGNSVLLQTDPGVTSWGTDYWGYWEDPYTIEGNEITYTIGLTQTTYTFDVLDDGRVDVRKLLIVTQYLSGDTTMTFTHPGIYEPIDGDGDDDEPNTAPVADIVASNTEGTAPLYVSFSGTGSTDAEIYTLSYDWDFGDGSTGNGATTVHVYNSPGTYTATLTVSDGELSDTASVEIMVTEQTPVDFCDNPEETYLPLRIRGRGEYCYVVSDPISYVNSWGLKSLTINGQDFTNTWSNNLPEPINGKWYISYEGKRRWSYFQAAQ